MRDNSTVLHQPRFNTLENAIKEVEADRDFWKEIGSIPAFEHDARDLLKLLRELQSLRAGNCVNQKKKLAA